MRIPVEGDRCLDVECHGDNDGTPVLLVHGGAMNRHNWDTLVPVLLAAGHHTITIDMRACGCSDRDFVAMDVPSLGADVVRVLDALGVSRAAVIGWSVGGAVAVAAAHALGRRVDRLVVIDGAAPRLREDVDYPGMPPAAFDAAQQALADDRAGFWRAMSSILFRESRPDVVEQCWQQFMSSGTQFDKTLASLADLDQRPLLADITAPTLVCHGRHDLYVDVTFGERLAAGLPNAQFIVFEKSGHAPFLEEPQAFHAQLLGFLGKG
jgi:non-heme chloroperoxidase